MAIAPFEETNAAFVDLVIRRWELRLVLAVEAAHSNPVEGSPAADALAYTDAELEGRRATARAAGKPFPLDRLLATYKLDAVEAAILELALIPQLDLDFRHNVARFNNNILYDFVDVDLVLRLLFGDRATRLNARSYFAADAPLVVNKLIRLRQPKEAKGTGILAKEVTVPERLADFVMARRSLDPSLEDFASLIDPPETLEDAIIPAKDTQDILGLIGHLRRTHGDADAAGPWPIGGGLSIALAGQPGTGKSLLANALANALGRPVLRVDCGRLVATGEIFTRLLESIFAEARVQGAVLVLDRCEPLFSKANQRLASVYGELESFGGLAVLIFTRDGEMDGSLERHVAWQLQLDTPDADAREAIWRLHLSKTVPIDPELDLEDMATRYEITGGQIASACRVAEQRVLTGGREERIDLELLKAAAQGQLRANMEDYSVRSKISLTLDDLILPDKEKALIQEVLDACNHRVYVMSKWGFGRRLVTGKGICVLFKGEPGTGKTLCAEILANELGMQLYQISIPKIMSKFIGETEKNIAKIFSTARANHSMLLFDEADSLFTKRVSVENAIDRFSNMETNMLLQEIERFEGITILTTNLDKNIDDAFARRIQFKIEFPFPEGNHRGLIWRTLIPKECPIDGEIDFDELGEAFELAGGNIKNAVIRAAYRAASRDRAISFEDIQFAAEQECKNAGKLFRVFAPAKDW